MHITSYKIYIICARKSERRERTCLWLSENLLSLRQAGLLAPSLRLLRPSGDFEKRPLPKVEIMFKKIKNDYVNSCFQEPGQRTSNKNLPLTSTVELTAGKCRGGGRTGVRNWPGYYRPVTLRHIHVLLAGLLKQSCLFLCFLKHVLYQWHIHGEASLVELGEKKKSFVLNKPGSKTCFRPWGAVWWCVMLLDTWLIHL